MPKNYRKRTKEVARLRDSLPAKAGQAPRTKSPVAHPKHKRRRLTDGLIGLSSAAILTVYSLGYLHTQNALGNNPSPEDEPKIRQKLSTITG